MNPRALLLALLLASPALASTPALHLIHFEDAAPSTTPLLAPELAALPYSFHLPALQFQGEMPSLPLPLPLPAMPDEGGGAGVSSDVVPILAILLSLFIGFGTGHLLVKDREGFVLFLVVDVVLWAVGGILTAVLNPFFWVPYGAGLFIIISHVIQVLDVYGKAYGTKLLDRARDRMVLAEPPPVGPDQLLQVGTSRVLRFAF